MNATLLLVLAASVGAPAKKDAPKNEIDIVGEWIVESSVRNGKEIAEKTPTSWIFTKYGKLSIRESGKDVLKKPWNYSVNLQAEPMTIDLIMPDDDDPLRFRGVLKFDGDKLTMCLAEIEQPRPTEFASKAGTKHSLSVFKRVKQKD